MNADILLDPREISRQQHVLLTLLLVVRQKIWNCKKVRIYPPLSSFCSPGQYWFSFSACHSHLAFCTRPFHRNRWLTRVPTRWCHTVFWDQVLKHGVCYIYSWHSSPLNKHDSHSDHVGCSSQSLPSRFPNQCVQVSQSNYQVCRNNPFDDATQKLYEGPALSCLMHMHVQLNSASKRSLRVTISL